MTRMIASWSRPSRLRRVLASAAGTAALALTIGGGFMIGSSLSPREADAAACTWACCAWVCPCIAAATTQATGEMVAAIETINESIRAEILAYIKLQEKSGIMAATYGVSLAGVTSSQAMMEERIFLGHGLNQSGQRSQAKRLKDAQMRGDFALEIQKLAAGAELASQDMPSACYFETAAATLAGAQATAAAAHQAAEEKLKADPAGGGGLLVRVAGVNTADAQTKGASADADTLFGKRTIPRDGEATAALFIDNVAGPLVSSTPGTPATAAEVVDAAGDVRRRAVLSLARAPLTETLKQRSASADLGSWAGGATAGQDGAKARTDAVSVQETLGTQVERTVANVSWSIELKQPSAEGLARELNRLFALRNTIQYQRLQLRQQRSASLGALLALEARP